jgi:hypothetical protein
LFFRFLRYQDLGKSTTSSVVKHEKKIFDDHVKAILPVGESDLIQKKNTWNELKENQYISNFGIANLRTFPVSLQMLESRTSIQADQIFNDGTDVNLDDFRFATLYVTGFSALAAIGSLALLPSNVFPTLCYF